MNIRQLGLYTSNLKAQLEFYGDVLLLPIISQSATCIIFKVGTSHLKFTHKEASTPYHFAFNIPSNKITESLNWLRLRGIPMLAFEGNDIIDFSDWNAESVYFYDADKNIVELIARKNLPIIEEKFFDAQQLLNIGEIGVATDSIERTYGQLNAIHPLPIYDGNFDRFCAAGDEQGLFILADMNKKQWFPTGDVLKQSDFELQGDYHIAYKGGEVFMLNK